MNAQRLLEHFERLSEAPDAISRLRRFVLDVAARGQLVPQDPNDESAAELLVRMQREKKRLPEKKLVKHADVGLPRALGEQPFSVPSTWRWIRLGDVLLGDSQNGYSRKPDDALNGIPILRISAGTVRQDGIVAEEQHKLIGAVSSLERKRFQLQAGDLLACRFNGNREFVGRLTLFADYLGIDPIYPDKLIRLRLLKKFVMPELVRSFADSTPIRIEMEKYCATTVGNWGISAANLKKVMLTLPPLAEQHRIVAKVDELMALCDQLEAAKAEREQSRDRLVAASLHRLCLSSDIAEAADDPEASPAHATFTLDNLPRVTTRPAHIKQLRQTILNLAVRGRLVAQDSNDEPALGLLKRIAADKVAVVKVGKANEPEYAWVVPNKPFKVPAYWQWVPFGALICGADAGWSPRSESFPRSGDHWGVLKVSAVSWDRFLPEENKQLLPGATPPSNAVVHSDDFLISRANTSELVAKCVVVQEAPRNIILSDKIVRLQITAYCSKRFLSIVNNHADYARSHYAAEASGTSLSMKNVSRAVIYGLPIPLPPLAEQHRIVAKVDELMNLCDQIEAQLTTTEADSRRLLEAVLHEALAPAIEEAA